MSEILQLTFDCHLAEDGAVRRITDWIAKIVGNAKVNLAVERVRDLVRVTGLGQDDFKSLFDKRGTVPDCRQISVTEKADGRVRVTDYAVPAGMGRYRKAVAKREEDHPPLSAVPHRLDKDYPKGMGYVSGF